MIQGSYEWDDAKAALNVAKHGIPFELAVDACEDPHALWGDDPCQHEDRYRVIGMVRGMAVVMVITTERGDRTRIISARLANRLEITTYHTR